jgi:siroheme synthase (precorrin-2 oxidase/ferrochelatase)
MSQDYSDLLRDFTDAGVRFLVVGGYAVMEYTDPRFTKDLDVWVAPEPDNAARVYGALARFGAPLEKIDQADFCRPGIVYQVGISPVRVDVLTSLTGVEFEAAWQRRERRMLFGWECPVISLEDLIRNKEATARPRDRADARRLRQAARRRGGEG